MTKEQLHELFDENPDCGQIGFDGTCCDCGCPIKVTIALSETGFMVDGGVPYILKDGTKKAKCYDCYAKNPAYEQKCEVYSRVVGYYRPVDNFNTGKKLEFEQRKNFVNVGA